MSVEAKFRSLNKRTAECQRHVKKLEQIDSIRAREDVANQIRTELQQLEADIKVFTWTTMKNA